MIQGIGITEKGIEEVSANEIKELTGGNILSLEPGSIHFEVKDEEELFYLCYKTQSMNRVLLFLNEFPANEKINFVLKNFETSLKKIRIKKYFEKKASFKVECQRKGDHEFNSIDVESFVGELIIKKSEKECEYSPEVSLETPDLIFFVYLSEKKGYLGIDLCGKDLSKRYYKIFLQPATIKGTLAYALLKFSDFRRNELLLDPFCGCGTIPIEAAFFLSGKSINYYNKEFAFSKIKFFGKTDSKKLFEKFDKQEKSPGKKNVFGSDKELRCLANSKKNAKIAGVEKYADFSKIDVEWLDTKFNKNSIDKIITNPPQESKRTDKKQLEKIYKEFFYQAEFILKEKGTITLLCINPSLLEKHGKDYKFKKMREQHIFSGKQKYFVLVFQKHR